MGHVEFEDYSVKVKAELNDAVIAFLYEASGEVESQIKRNSRVDTGQTKGSYRYEIDEEKGESLIGSPLENAIWEEFGTGVYALNGDGRKTPWVYTNRHGETIRTQGKTPNRPIHKAFTSLQTKIEKRLESILKGL